MMVRQLTINARKEASLDHVHVGLTNVSLVIKCTVLRRALPHPAVHASFGLMVQTTSGLQAMYLGFKSCRVNNSFTLAASAPIVRKARFQS